MANYAGVFRTFKSLVGVRILLSSPKNFTISHIIPRLLATDSPAPISSTNQKLMEFFDDKSNWGQNEIKVGRSWLKDELRIKSNTDLHKLWFILLKERNMLLTMENESKEQLKLFPNPERIDKIEESMTNLECVVRERNEAYYQLEVGESGERPGKVTENILGLRYYYKMVQHVIPKFMNTSYREKMRSYQPNNAVSTFRRFYREKLWNEKRKARNRDFGHVVQLMKRFPNLDLETVKEQYPSVNIEKAKNHKKARAHSVPE